MANWRTKIKSPIFYLANVFCTCLSRNLARDASAVAVIQVEQSLKNTWRPCFQLLILSNSEHVFIIIVAMAMLKYVKREAHPSNEQSILSQQNIEEAQK